MKNSTLEQRLTDAEAGAVCSVLVTRLGGSYSRLLGIRLSDMDSDEVFKWFVAALLLGSPMRADSALAAYRGLERHELLGPKVVARIPERRLVSMLEEAGVDEEAVATAGMLQSVSGSLVVDFDADINRLHFFAEDEDDLLRRLRSLGSGVSPDTVMLFLREMRGVWDKARPGLSSPAVVAACCLGVIDVSRAVEVREQLHSIWEKMGNAGRTYADLEVALARLGENYCSLRRCCSCPINKLCISRVPVAAGTRVRG
ncbi:MAG: hypothetical protein JW846_10485 [Dehalococcoidia bacterium]|nr:hypothetical protein [Dehalococcoidia bacterium]